MLFSFTESCWYRSVIHLSVLNNALCDACPVIFFLLQESTYKTASIILGNKLRRPNAKAEDTIFKLLLCLGNVKKETSLTAPNNDTHLVDFGLRDNVLSGKEFLVFIIGKL